MAAAPGKVVALPPPLLSASVVELVMWTEMLWPGARLSPSVVRKYDEKVRLWLPFVPVMVKSPGLPWCYRSSS